MGWVPEVALRAAGVGAAVALRPVYYRNFGPSQLAEAPMPGSRAVGSPQIVYEHAVCQTCATGSQQRSRKRGSLRRCFH